MVVVTRHKALVEYLRETGVIPPNEDNVHVLSHAEPTNIAGCDVIGVLPLWIAVHAKTVTEVPLDLPPELRGVELTLDQIRQYAKHPETYVIENI